MKEILTALILTSLSVFPVIASAQEPAKPPELTWGTFYTYVIAAIWWLFAFAALVLFIVAGLLFLTAGGDPAKVANARNAFLYGVVGVIVAILAYSVVRIVTYLVARG